MQKRQQPDNDDGEGGTMKKSRTDLALVPASNSSTALTKSGESVSIFNVQINILML